MAAGLGVLHQVLCCLIYSPSRILECWEFSNRYMKFHPDVIAAWLNISAHMYYCVYSVCLSIYVHSSFKTVFQDQADFLKV